MNNKIKESFLGKKEIEEENEKIIESFIVAVVSIGSTGILWSCRNMENSHQVIKSSLIIKACSWSKGKYEIGSGAI